MGQVSACPGPAQAQPFSSWRLRAQRLPGGPATWASWSLEKQREGGPRRVPGRGRQVGSRVAERLAGWPYLRLCGLTAGPLRGRGSGVCAKAAAGVSPPLDRTSTACPALLDMAQTLKTASKWNQASVLVPTQAYGPPVMPVDAANSPVPSQGGGPLWWHPVSRSTGSAALRRRGHIAGPPPFRNPGQVCVNRWEGQEATVPSTTGGARGGCGVGVQPGALTVSGCPKSSAWGQARGH